MGEASTAEEAASIAETYRPCPYCVFYESTGRRVVGLFSLPADRRWWLEWVEESPQETLGLEWAKVAFPEGMAASSAWARGEVRSEGAQAPCKADCPDCRWYRDKCEGCPATTYYAGG